MAHTNPFPLNIYWSSTVELVDGVVGVNNSFADETVCIDAKYSFDDFMIWYVENVGLIELLYA
jgi:hypothetical protein